MPRAVSRRASRRPWTSLVRRRPRPASSSTSPIARTPTRPRALDALRASFGEKIAPLQLGDRRGRVVRWLRRSRSPQGVPLGWLGRGRDPDPRRHGRRGRAPARPAPRSRRRSRRRRADQVPRGRGDRRRRARGLPAQGRQGERAGAGPGRQLDQGHRPPWPPRCDRPLPPLPRRRAAGRRRPTRAVRRSRSRPTRTARSSCAYSRRPPIRSSAG